MLRSRPGLVRSNIHNGDHCSINLIFSRPVWQYFELIMDPHPVRKLSFPALKTRPHPDPPPPQTRTPPLRPPIPTPPPPAPRNHPHTLPRPSRAPPHSKTPPDHN